MTPERASKAVQYLIDSATKYGAARAEAQRADDMLRVIKALMMAQSNQKSAAAQERDAYASQRYQEAVDAKFEAVKESETLRASREAAIQTIEAWRSMNANQRSAERGYSAGG
jgi:hypothetical protein